jgi:phosphate:Na+ symporter
MVGMFIAIVISSVQIVLPVDPITGKHLSGSGQVLEVGKEFKPFRLKVVEEGIPLKNYPVEFFLVIGDTLERKKVFTDSLGYAQWIPSPVEREGEGHVLVRVDDKYVKYRFYVVRRGFGWLILFQLIGGFALFFFGLRRGGSGLLRIAGAKMRRLLFDLTKTRILGVFAGFLATVVLQSSTAATVMLVSFVESGLLSLESSLAAALGAGIGTTLTVQVLAFKIFDFAVFIIALGYFIERTTGRLRPIGRAILGFGLVFLGIKIMADGAGGLSLYPWFKELLLNFSGKVWLGILLATLFTALVHSSAAVIGVALSMSFKGLLPLEAAIPIVIGANVGTSTTALLASLSGRVEGKRFAFGNFILKIVGALFFIPLLTPFAKIVQFTASDVPRQIANAHTLFNLTLMVLFFPLIAVVTKVCRTLLKGEAGVEEQILEPRLLAAPELAISFAQRKVLQMGDKVYFMLRESIRIFVEKNQAILYRIVKEDDEVDKIEEELTPFLTKLFEEELSPELSKRLMTTLFIIDEFEHIGDILSKNIVRYGEKMYKEGLCFSEEGLEEIKSYHREVLHTLEMALAAYTSWNMDLARKVWERREVLHKLGREYHLAHLDRLAKGTKESLLTSTIHLDLISDLERINFHAASVGASILGKVE